METNDKTALIFTDSRITLESLKNWKNHTYLIEKIGKKVIEMENQDWKIKLTWIKEHAEHHGNELADQTAKEASTCSDIEYYRRIPKSTVRRELGDNSVIKWQVEWDKTTNKLQNYFFPK